MMAGAYLCAVAAYGCTVAAQLLLKHGAVAAHGRHFTRLWWNPWTFGGYGLFFLATLFSLKAFQVLPLKIGVYMGALSLVAVVFGSRWFFREKLSPRSRAGLLLVLAGVLVFNWPA